MLGAALQRLHDYYLRTICHLLPSTPRKLLLTELGLLPLQVIWWRQTLQFWNSLAVVPVGSLYHTVCLYSLTEAFQGGAFNMASSLAGCLRSVGFEIPCVHDVVPVLDVDGVVDSNWALAGYRFWQSVLSSCSPHSRGCFMRFKPYSPGKGVLSTPCFWEAHAAIFAV